MISKAKNSGSPKVYDDTKLDADSCQTQEKLAFMFELTQQTISLYFKSLEMIRKHENWVPYELKPKNGEHEPWICELLFTGHFFIVF